MPPATHGLYQANLRSLRQRQPDVAAALDATTLPQDIEFTCGRDRRPTCLLPAEGGRRRWFGGSSMPSVSAEAAFSTYNNDGRNVVLPGVQTGEEPLVLLDRLPPHTAAFVAERTEGNVKIAFHIRDYTEMIDTGRLVFLLGEGESFVAGARLFFDRNPGYELPVKLLTVPQQSSAEIFRIQSELAEAGHAVMDVQTKRVEEHVVRLNKAKIPNEIPGKPSLAILSVDPNANTRLLVERIREALNTLGWNHSVCIPDAPHRCHVSQRLQTVLECNADLVLMINSGAGAIGSFLPRPLPIATWYTPDAQVQSIQENVLSEREVFFAPSSRVVDALVRAGVPRERIHDCPPAAQPDVSASAMSRCDDPTRKPVDVCILLDVPDDRPQSWNVNLASHVALWNAIRDTVERSADRYRNDDIDTYLAHAESCSGTVLKDPKIRDHFLSLTRSYIIPAALARHSIGSIRGEQLSVSIWGSRWMSREDQPAAGRQDDYHGPIPTGEQLRGIIRSARWVLIPALTPALVPTALDALASGTAIAIRRCDPPLDGIYPGLASVVRYFNQFETSGELVGMLRLDPGDTRMQSKAQNEILENHTTARRLTSIVQTMRSERSFQSTKR